MGRIVTALTAFYRRWKYVEEADVPRGETGPGGSEAQRLRRAIERDERLSADYRRNGCLGLAKDLDASVRSLRSRLSLLD